ncbi:unnamed protein product [Rotaria socialis]|uniref:Uncharacterized protein n=2 Tax=Rotaria socialis TaxID=392032 RepID=A0A818PRP5_9BILA|nr:unnamed protein product [Rotaria socialis]CAF3625091.1 unnamed protein product [Rotaria socialis]CAF4161397.1 unnamed protein product [Rotaria socialis]CAF4163565.1 unnamed protein product [Rotaria socialis]
MTTNNSSFANTNRSVGNLMAPNGQASSNSNENNNNSNNEEDQLNRINLQTLQNRDPYISKIVDQAQRVCVYKFVAEKREWERKDLEGTLFVYERLCKPYHGFAILSTVSRETFVQIIKSSMEFKHTPAYEAFLQYKVDVGDIYGIWFISKTDCPRVTECLKCLTEKAKEYEQTKPAENVSYLTSQKSNEIISLLTNAHDKFEESKRKQQVNNSESLTQMPAVLLRLFSTQETSTQSTIVNGERGEELKRTLNISGKSALSVTELEKQLLQSPSSQNQETTKPVPVNDTLEKFVSLSPKSQNQTASQSISPHTVSNLQPTTLHSKPFHELDSISTNANRLMTPADFKTLRLPKSPVHSAPAQAESSFSASCYQWQHPQSLSTNSFSKDNLRKLLVHMLQNDEELVTGLHDAYIEKQAILNRIYS